MAEAIATPTLRMATGVHLLLR